MKAVILRDYDGMPRSMEYGELPLPEPRHGEVVIKMSAAPINPSDLVFLRARYGIVKPLPVVISNESMNSCTSPAAILARSAGSLR